jgi:holliday junction DNA helicase RuvA
MIGKISGRLDWRGPDHVLIDVRGVGYIVYASDRTLAAMPPLGQAVALYTELVVREDLLQLFGFVSMIEKEWHKLLTSVQGVGPNAALAMMGALGAEGVARAISLGDVRAVQSAQGVGPKLAQRVILELKSKAPNLMALGASLSAEASSDDVVIEDNPAPAQGAARKAPSAAASASAARASAMGDALSALTNLGYGTGDAASALASITSQTPDADTQTLIRAALKALAPKA